MRPPAMGAETRRKLRRPGGKSLAALVAGLMRDLLRQLMRSRLDRLANADIGRSAAEIPAHRLLDVAVAWSGRALEKGHRAHNLSALPAAALDDVVCDHGGLHAAPHP